MTNWISEVSRLAKFAHSQSHAAFAGLTHGLICKWLYLIRVTEAESIRLLEPLETALRMRLVPAITVENLAITDATSGERFIFDKEDPIMPGTVHGDACSASWQKRTVSLPTASSLKGWG